MKLIRGCNFILFTLSSIVWSRDATFCVSLLFTDSCLDQSRDESRTNIEWMRINIWEWKKWKCISCCGKDMNPNQGMERKRENLFLFFSLCFPDQSFLFHCTNKRREWMDGRKKEEERINVKKIGRGEEDYTNCCWLYQNQTLSRGWARM